MPEGAAPASEAAAVVQTAGGGSDRSWQQELLACDSDSRRPDVVAVTAWDREERKCQTQHEANAGNGGRMYASRRMWER